MFADILPKSSVFQPFVQERLIYRWKYSWIKTSKSNIILGEEERCNEKRKSINVTS